VTEAVGCEQLA